MTQVEIIDEFNEDAVSVFDLATVKTGSRYLITEIIEMEENYKLFRGYNLRTGTDVLFPIGWVTKLQRVNLDELIP